MAAGGIYDQLGGGFSRYSVDQQWLVPHFEKMLYDNAQLLSLYLDAFLVSGQPGYAAVAHDIIRYLLRDMTHPEGGFYSAEDADSEGKEGKFYCWTEDELSKLLTPEEFNVARKYFGLTREGNFVDHSDPDPLPNQNVLSIVDPQVPPDDQALLANAKDKMMRARAQRVRPHLDDKILASWNGLMLGALARAAVVLSRPEYLSAAEKNYAFLRGKLWDPTGRTLYHRWRDGAHDTVQLLEAYAFLGNGVLELYQATLKPEHLDFAVSLAEVMLQQFYDAADGGFWQTQPGSTDLILRVKDDYDGAEPSGNSVAVLLLLKLGAITGRAEFTSAAEKSLALFSDRIHQLPQAVCYMLVAADFASAAPQRVVIAGDLASPHARPLLESAHQVYQPGKVVLGTEGAVEPFAGTLKAKGGSATAFICTGNACLPPTDDPATVAGLLNSRPK
jgi:uncharacterized protein YyaL (SSP411 family)